MKGAILSGRYAKSLLGLAAEQGNTDEVFNDMQLIADTCAANRELSVLLRSPIVKLDKKDTILHELFGDKIGQLSHGFIKLLVSKGRESYLEGVANSYVRQYKVSKGVQTAVITTAVELDDAARARVMEIVKDAYTGSTVELEERVDKEIIGGIILRVGDRQVDASIARKLNDLQTEFSKNPYVREF